MTGIEFADYVYGLTKDRTVSEIQIYISGKTMCRLDDNIQEWLYNSEDQTDTYPKLTLKYLDDDKILIKVIRTETIRVSIDEGSK